MVCPRTLADSLLFAAYSVSASPWFTFKKAVVCTAFAIRTAISARSLERGGDANPALLFPQAGRRR